MVELKLNTIAAIIGIVILEAIALFNGIDGLLFFTVIAILSGLGGVILLDDAKQIIRLYYKPPGT